MMVWIRCSWRANGPLESGSLLTLLVEEGDLADPVGDRGQNDASACRDPAQVMSLEVAGRPRVMVSTRSPSSVAWLSLPGARIEELWCRPPPAGGIPGPSESMLGCGPSIRLMKVPSESNKISVHVKRCHTPPTTCRSG